jgi:hypothetical protein
MSLHRNVAPVDVHIIHAFSYADAAARTGAVGLVAADCGKVGWQLDNNTFWALVSVSPVTWVLLSTASTNDPFAIHTNVSGEIAGLTEKTVPVGADLLVIEDSEAANVKKKVQVLNLRKWKQSVHVDVSTDVSTTSATFVDLLTANITTAAANALLLLRFSAATTCSNNSTQIAFRYLVDGVAYHGAGNLGYASSQVSTAIIGRKTVASAGAHTVKVQWRTDRGTVYVNAATVPDTQHACLVVEETY